MHRGPTGRYEEQRVGEEAVRAFVPDPLPPDPPLDLAPLQGRLEAASLALGRLDGLSTVFQDVRLFLYFYIRKEAVLSSQIEGTQSSLSDLLLFELQEAPGVPVDDVVEVSNYVAALEYGLEQLRQGFPLCNRLLREIHARLLQSGRGSSQDPGEFRRSQNWVGGSRPGNAAFVPPPPLQVPDCMADLERFLHDRSETMPVLIRTGLAHVQFETIHPFLDGNGRAGRLLITLLLWNDGVLRSPVLYLSLYLKQNRQRYYELLDRVRTEGDWEAWLAFFLDGVAQTADQAVRSARRLTERFREDRERVQAGGRKVGSALRVHRALTEHPLLSIGEASRRTGLSFPAASSGMGVLEDLGIAREITGRNRNRLYAYREVLAILDEGTELS